MKKYLLCGLCILAIIALSGCVSNTNENAQSKVERDIVIIGTKAGIFGFQPWMTNYETSTMSVNFNIFDGLVEFDKNYKITPALATNWENPNDLTWRFHMRKGVKFHNGYDFRAEDVKYTLELLKNDPGSVLKDLLTGIDRIEVVDEYTVDVITKEPYPILLNKLADCYIVSKKYQEEATDHTPVGTGCYKLAEYVEGDHITLEAFDGCWRTTPKINKAIFKVIENDDDRVNSLISGQIDIAESVPVGRTDELKYNQATRVIYAPSTRIIYLSFDFRKENSYGYGTGKNPTSDVRVRKAMYYAIDEDMILSEIMKGLGQPASQFVPPSIFGYDPAIKRLSYDLDEAKRLIAEAGYENGFNITLECPNNRYVNDEAVCNEIGRQLAQININVNVNARPKAEYFPKVLSRNTSFYMLGWATDTADGGEIFDFLIRTVDDKNGVGGYNNGYYSNPDVDRLGVESSRTINPEARLSIMHEGFEIAMEDVAWIPLHTENLIYGTKSDLTWEPRSDVKIKLESIS
ncbi:MAG: ABC transporter substrate-binding protein [Candidatus Aenigmatarchaeota archaeon]